MGGVATNLHGAISLPVFSPPEKSLLPVSMAPIAWANNSLLQGLVFGARSATAMLNNHTTAAFPSAPTSPHAASPAATTTAVPPIDLSKAVEEARNILWQKVAIIRNGKQLSEGVKRLSELPLAVSLQPSRQSQEVSNILCVARLIARCALAREESRGAHYRSDFPLKDSTKPPRHSYVSKNSPPFFA